VFQATFCDFKYFGQLKYFSFAQSVLPELALHLIELNIKKTFDFPHVMHWNEDKIIREFCLKTDFCHTCDMVTSIRTYIYVRPIGLTMSNREIHLLLLAL
jgi:hypothetical protein